MYHTRTCTIYEPRLSWYPKGRNCSHLQLVSASRACLTRGFSGGGRQDKSLNCRPTTPHHHSVLRSGSIENEHPIRYMIRYSKSDSVCDSRERDPRMTAPTSASQHQHLSPPFSPLYPNSIPTSDDTNFQLSNFKFPHTARHISQRGVARAPTLKVTQYCDSRERDPRMTAPTSASQHQHLSPPFSPLYPNSIPTSDDTNFQLSNFKFPHTARHISQRGVARAPPRTRARLCDHCAASVDCMCGALHPPFVRRHCSAPQRRVGSFA